MKNLRKRLRSLRFLVWFALAFAIFAYVARPLRKALWKPVDPASACAKLARGQPAFDRWGTALAYDSRTAAARSAGPDKKWNTPDDLVIGCRE